MDDVKRIAIVETKTVDNGTIINNPTPIQRYQLGNNIESAVLELDENASIICYEEYYPYGETSYRAGRNANEVSQKRYRYTGKEKDEESGLYYYGARYYICWLGRWTAVDPIWLDNQNIHNSNVELEKDNLLENVDTIKEFLNLYLFVQCNPIIRIDSEGCYSMRQTDSGDYEKVPENEDPNASNIDRIDAVFMNEEWMQEQMAEKEFNPNNKDLTDEIRAEWAEMARIALNNEDVFADIANRSEKIEHGVYFNSERITMPSFKLYGSPITPFISQDAAGNSAQMFLLQTISIPDVGKLGKGTSDKMATIPGAAKENEVHTHPTGRGILSPSDTYSYDFYELKRNMFVIGAQSGQVSVTNRNIRDKFELEQLPIGFISLNNKRPVSYQK
jgi:RHS repeat-associated protein